MDMKKTFRLPPLLSREKKDSQPGRPVQVGDAQAQGSEQRREDADTASADAVDGTESSTGGRYGFKVLYSPREPKPTADVVFVHGLTGHREATWTGGKGPTRVLWPEKLLPTKIPGARISTYGYDADYATFWRMQSRNNIANHASNLITDLANLRDEDETTEIPIIFVAHSLGGLLVKKALTDSENGLDTHKQNVVKQTYAIAFLGTPHLGADKAGWIALWIHFAAVFKSVNHNIVKVLQPDSEDLASIDQNFHTLLRKRTLGGAPINIVCFYEELAVRTIGVIVPHRSEQISGYNSVGVHANHQDMTKFGSSTDLGYLKVSAEISRWIGQLASRPCDPPQDTTNRGPFFLLPISANPSFIHRIAIETRLKECFPTRQTHTRATLHGLGGSGKTQIALSFAQQFHELVPEASIFWVYASNHTRFAQDYRKIAQEAGLSVADTSDSDVLQLVVTWLDKQSSPWLMIIDNADDEKMFCHVPGGSSIPSKGAQLPQSLLRYIPRCVNGSILVTSRNRAAAVKITGTAPIIDVPPMDPAEALSLLTSSISSPTNHEDTERLAALLDHIPLAMVQAAAYIEERCIEISAYIDEYESNEEDRRDLMSTEFTDLQRDPDVHNAVISTWSISFKHIQEKDLVASSILSLMSYLDRSDIPKMFVIEQNSLQQFNKAIGLLKSFAMVTSREGSSNYDIHGLTQLAVRSWIGTETACIDNLSCMLREYISDGSGSEAAVYLPHILSVLRHSGEDPERADDLNFAYLRSGCCEYRSALDLHRKACEAADRYLGKADPVTIKARICYAEILNSLGQLTESELILCQLSETLDGLAGCDAINEMTSTDSLRVEAELQIAGALLRNKIPQGRYLEARDIFDSVPFIGAGSSTRAEDKLELMMLACFSTDEHQELEKVCRKLLERRRARYPEHHQYVQVILDYLAQSLSGQSRGTEALEILDQTLHVREDNLGPDNPETLTVLHNYAACLSNLGHHERAEMYMQRALWRRTENLGPSHPRALSSLRYLGLIYSRQQRFPEAEAVFREALVKERGKDEPNTFPILKTLPWLAESVGEQGRHHEAAELYLEAAKGWEGLLGESHADTLTTWQTFAFHLSKQRKHTEALDIYNQVLQRRKEALGEDHIDTAASYHYMATAMWKAERYQEALELEQKAYAIALGKLGPDDETTKLYEADVLLISEELADQEQVNDAPKETENEPAATENNGASSPENAHETIHMVGWDTKLSSYELCD
ncbi:hypothetical protein MMC30_005246 [Trapelia coarctata]|nr:hypothetical protein [Trapelia coarctata]